MNSVRTMIRGENAGSTRTVGGSSRRLGGSRGTPTARSFPGRAAESSLHWPEEGGAQTGDAEDARTRMGADHGADLGDELRVAAEYLAAAFGEALAAADRSLVLPIYPARERHEDYPAVSAQLIAAGAHPASFAEAAALLASELGPGDLCLVMGAGDVDELGRMLVARGEVPA
jgi:hypothetical protein